MPQHALVAPKEVVDTLILDTLPGPWQAIFKDAGVEQQDLNKPENVRQIIELLTATLSTAQLQSLPPLPGIDPKGIAASRPISTAVAASPPSSAIRNAPSLEPVRLPPPSSRETHSSMKADGSNNKTCAVDSSSSDDDGDEKKHKGAVGMEFLRDQLGLSDEKKVKSIKTTVCKTVVAIELSRSWTELIVLVRPVAFGMPIEVEHKPGCHESLLLLAIVFVLASSLLYMVSKVKFATAGLVTSSAFMWAGATFSPTATECIALFTVHPLAATVVYTLFAAMASVTALWLNAWVKERYGGTTVVDVAAMSLTLVSVFIVISAAAVCNKAIAEELPWTHKSYMGAYLHHLDSLGAGPAALTKPAVPSECKTVVFAVETPLLINPALVALVWALAGI